MAKDCRSSIPPAPISAMLMPTCKRFWPKRIGNDWSILVLGPLMLVCLFLVFTWSFTLARSDEERQQAIDNAQADNLNTAVVVKAALEQHLGKTTRYAQLSSAGLQGEKSAALDLGNFLRLFQDLQLGPGGRIEIIGADGYQLAASGGATLASGRDYRGSAYLDLLSGRQGFGIVDVPGESRQAVLAFKRLDGLPLTVVVSRDQEHLLAQFADKRASRLRWTTFASILLLIGSFSLLQLARRQRRINQSLVESEINKHKLIEALEAEKQKAYHLGFHDQLTGLPNRALFAQLAGSHLAGARRSRKYFAVLFIDLDHFKTINDTLGHRIGDLLLATVAERLRSCLRQSDVVARFGGDEFVMLLNAVDSIDDISMLAQKIVHTVGEPCRDLEGHDLEVSPSVGIALYRQDGEEIDVLLRCADAAMYEAKAAGRGTFRFFDAVLNARSSLQLELTQGIRRAIRENEFLLHYQPRVSLHDFSLTGFEALLRWQHPDHGLLYPDSFISMAERKDLIIPVGQWVIHAACTQLASWRQRGLPLQPIAVNVSAKQLRDDHLVGVINAALAEFDLPAHLLEIEITESCFIEAPERAQHILGKLVALGLKISIDDYGTGFSSLSHLKTLPIYAIKIDRSFVREIHRHSNDAMIVSSTISLAHNLKLKVVAEGVESKDQLLHLKAAGCDEVQGYYFQRPAPAAQIEHLLSGNGFPQ